MIERVVEIGSPALAGIYTSPERDTDLGFVLLNAGLIHRVGSSRLYVSLARRAAEIGFGALRFDFSGMGESPSRSGGGRAISRMVSETQEVLDFLGKARGLNRFVVCGLCSGAEAALAAGAADPRVIGVAQLDPWAPPIPKATVRRILPKLLSADVWKNAVQRSLSSDPEPDVPQASQPEGPTLEEQLLPENATKQEVEEKLKVLLARDAFLFNLYTGSMELYIYENQFRDTFPGLDFRDRLSVSFIREADHAFTRVEHQTMVVRDVAEWLGRVRDKADHSGAPAGNNPPGVHQPREEGLL